MSLLDEGGSLDRAEQSLTAGDKLCYEFPFQVKVVCGNLA